MNDQKLKKKKVCICVCVCEGAIKSITYIVCNNIFLWGGGVSGQSLVSRCHNLIGAKKKIINHVLIYSVAGVNMYNYSFV